MKIHISNEAADWYKEEMLLKNGDFIRFFARYGGCSTVQKGFSLGISIEEPNEIGAKREIDGITFYVEDKDLWYFDEQDLFVDFNTKIQEPEFRYSK